MSYEMAGESEAFTAIREMLELPETIALLERPQEISGESGETPSESPCIYSDAYVDESGTYHSEQITGIYADALGVPGFREIAKDLGEWQQQEKELSCAVQCQRMVINDLTGLDLTESALRKQGKEMDLYQDERGTYTEDVGKLAEHYGLEREQFEDMSIPELIRMKQEGTNVILAVDALLLAHPELDKISSPNHAVEVIGFDLSDSEHPKVIINDPGRADGRGAAYPIEIFEKAACKTDANSGEKTLHCVTAIYEKEGIPL